MTKIYTMVGYTPTVYVGTGHKCCKCGRPARTDTATYCAAHSHNVTGHRRNKHGKK